MKKLAIAAILGFSLTCMAERNVSEFNSGWMFTEIDSGASENFRPVTIPHDWSMEHSFDRGAASGNDGGYVTTGKGLYRKTFLVPEKDSAQRHVLYFEGVYQQSTVKVNGKTAGGHPYGYSSFYVDITPYVRPGEKNTVEVSVDNSTQKNCRWYTGSGIYRDVTLINTGRAYLHEQGIFARPVYNESDSSWLLSVSADYTDANMSSAIRHTLLDAAGNVVGTVTGTDSIMSIPVVNPALWSPDSPYIYTLTTELLDNEGRSIDMLTTVTGFRRISYSAENGLLLNGEPIILNGGCVHHDNGILGARSYHAAEARKVALLKEAGFNAVRTSHNIPSTAFLDECDRQGLLVIDEVFDGWRDSKTPADYSTLFDNWWKKDVEAMVMRDRNHPSIFCWSIGNEVIERKKLEVITTASRLASHVKSMDSTRPVTSALTTWDSDWEIFDPLAAVHDIAGYNYQLHHHASDHKRVPDRIIMQTESYPRDAWANYTIVRNNPYVIGDFVWTAIDYLGESGIGRYFYKGQTEGEHYDRNQYPWHGAYCGDIDLIGWRKPISHYREMLYNPSKQTCIGVREPSGYKGEIRETMWSVWPTWESWNWPGHEGKDIEVEVYSHMPKVRLYLNDRLIGEQAAGEANQCKTIFRLPYEPGTLKAEGVSPDGAVSERFSLSTSGEPASIRLTPHRYADDDVIFVEIEIVDKDGRPVADAASELSCGISGNGEILATGSADLTDNTPYYSTTRKVWNGRALAAIKKTSAKKGKAQFRVSSPGLPSTKISL